LGILGFRFGVLRFLGIKVLRNKGYRGVKVLRFQRFSDLGGFSGFQVTKVFRNKFLKVFKVSWNQDFGEF
jgi:hypothetical protein